MSLFPGSSAGKKSTCSAADPSSVSGSGRSPGEGIGYPVQYSWASMVTQLVENPPAMQETWVQSLGWKGPMEKETATHSSILFFYSCLNSRDRGTWQVTIHGVTKSRT